MKTFASPCGILAIVLLALSSHFVAPMMAQTIQIDSTFTSDGEIFPFSPNDTIYGLSISGSVTLNSDTSLVRVILTDNAGNEWMVYEAYPFINPNWHITLSTMADETKYINVASPTSIIIQLINATFTFNSIILESELTENLTLLQQSYKEFIESRKTDSMNYIIEDNQMLWFSDQTSISRLSYKYKSELFGHKYNLCGLDYYTGGIFDPVPGVIGPIDTSPLVDYWDWRTRHGANDPEKDNFYYDQDIDGTGWLTEVEYQKEIPECVGLCYIYGPLGAIEGFANLYLNNHVNYNLSEQNILDCDTDYTSCEGGSMNTTHNEVIIDGVVDEACYPRDNFVDYCRINAPPNGSPSHWLKISGAFPVSSSAEELKTAIISKGPLSVGVYDYYEGENHAMVLIGYKILKANDTFYKNPGDEEEITIEEGSPYIGHLAWIYKNSWGKDHGDKGFIIHLDEDFHPVQPRYYEHIDDILTEAPENEFIEPKDLDHDGYWNWGITEHVDLPEGVCPDLGLDEKENEDSDDSENRIGPFDENYYGKPVKPKMIVTAGPSNAPVTNHGFYFMGTQSPQTITITISNPGNAQLNIAALIPVTISQVGTDFHLINNPASKVCMGDETDFQIGFDTHSPNEFQKAVVSIQLAQCDSDIYDEFEFALVYNYDCEFNENAYGVSGYEAWNDYRIINQNVFIDDNATLEVFGSVAMNEESNILIAAGGQLIVNGGLITGSCNTSWHGVDVWGDIGLPQTLDNQGKISVKNGGCIEYAETAIETAILDGYGRHIPTGGLVSCSDAIFKDNVTDINLYPYRNYNPYNYQILPNFSRFTRTRFETTDDFYSLFSVDPNAHVFMDEVLGINFTGCTFGNYSMPANHARGKGIESYGAGYSIFKACTQDNLLECPGSVPCRFENLDYGIRAFNTNGFATIKADSVDFFHNRRGMHLVLVENPTIIRSTFEVSDQEGFWTGDDLVGLYLDQYTTGFVVEENDFIGSGTYSSAVGIHLLNTGTDQNEIYNNNFISLYNGITAVGINRLSDRESEGVGLCIKCNDFQQCRNDVYVTYELDGQGNPIVTENTGIAQKQGLMNEGAPYDNTLAAGNSFSEVNSANYFNDKDCGQIEYTYHGINNSDLKIIPAPISGINPPQPDYDATYTKAGSCPSHLGGSITLSMEKNILSTETNLLLAYEDTLLMTIDGGNTEALNFDVITSYPEEALALRQELIDESPFLSDTVMISAIEKEDVLPSAMIRDILVQNPHAPKSKKVMDAVDQRQDSIPEYMMEEILQGLNIYGARELLEQELGSHIAKRDQAWKNLNLFYKNDTLNIASAIDSLIILQQAENWLSTRYDLAFMLLYVEDSTNVFKGLNDIPNEFDLSEEEVSSHSNYMELFNFLWNVKHDTSGLDSLQIQILFNLADYYRIIPGLYASNILIKERLLNYEEPVYLADPLKNTRVHKNIHHSPTDNQYLVLFPNPAGNYFIAYYYLDNQQLPGVLTISSIKGIELKAINLKDKHNQVVIPTWDLSAGTYLVRLFGRNQLIGSQKLILIK